jgi:hypothetical protein
VIVKAAASSANDSTFGIFGGVQVVQFDYNKPDTLTNVAFLLPLIGSKRHILLMILADLIAAIS